MSFDGVAWWYRWIEYATFGRQLEECRRAWMGELVGRGRVLIVGEGDGRFLEELLRRDGAVRVVVVEQSAVMRELAAERVAWARERVEFVAGDAREVVLPEGEWDAVVTLFLLDCFGEDDCRALVGKLAGRLREGGVWLVSEFEVPGTGWARWQARVWVGVMYGFFRVVAGLQARELPPVGRCLEAAGMVRAGRREWRGGMMVAEAWRKGVRVP